MNARSAEIVRLFLEENMTFTQIGQRYGITCERVRQIVKRETNLKASEGGIALKRRQRNMARKQASRERVVERVRKTYNCSYEQWEVIHAAGGLHPYWRQQEYCRYSNIEWNLTLLEWWDFWQKSGKWELRGRKKGGFGLFRIDTSKGYSIDNIVIARCGYEVSMLDTQRKVA